MIVCWIDCSAVNVKPAYCDFLLRLYMVLILCHSFTYIAQLEKTEQYWRGWYEGLSEKYLSAPVPKLLLLAGTDRLDRFSYLIETS